MGEEQGCPWGQPHRSFPGPRTLKKRGVVAEQCISAYKLLQRGCPRCRLLSISELWGSRKPCDTDI